MNDQETSRSDAESSQPDNANQSPQAESPVTETSSPPPQEKPAETPAPPVNVAPDLPERPSIIKIMMAMALLVLFVVSIVFNVMSWSLGSDAKTLDTTSVIFMGLSLLLAIISLGLAYWMHYVRAIYLKDGPALVPEQWGKVINDLARVIGKSGESTSDVLSSLVGSSNQQAQKADSLLESFLTLQQAISSRDDEIARLKGGYDAKLYKRFLNKFIRLSQSINEIYGEAKGTPEEKNYRYLSRSIAVALEDCGVDTYEPEVDTDYREVGAEVADDPNEIETDDPQKDFMIASVDSPAYIVEGEGERQIIIQSKVTIYRHQQQNTPQEEQKEEQ